MIISADFSFEASHVVGSGRCARLHGHSWKLRVDVVMAKTTVDMVNNVSRVQTALRKGVATVLEAVDFQHLNFIIINPTCQNVAMYISTQLRSLLLMGALETMVDDFIVTLNDSQITASVSYKETRLLPNATESVQGWHHPFTKIVKFSDLEAQRTWLKQTRKQLYSALRAMDNAGQRLYAYVAYRKSMGQTLDLSEEIEDSRGD